MTDQLGGSGDCSRLRVRHGGKRDWKCLGAWSENQASW